MSGRWALWLGVLVVTIGGSAKRASAQQDEPLPAAQALPATSSMPTQQDPEAKTDNDKPVVETLDRSGPVNPREVRLHLWDGNVITGELGVEQITIQTEFGQLKVPVEKIVSFRPGLDSFPQLRQRIDKLVEDLGSDDYATREAAHKGLLAMALPLRREIYRFQDGGNAERKRHLESIRKEIETMLEDLADDDENSREGESAELIQGDQIRTRDFVIVGKIAQETFGVSSKYGPLSVQLGDVQFADRQQTGNVERRSTVSVTGKHYAQSNRKATGIRLNRGDRVTVRAEGQISMSPWGNQAMVGPDGNMQYGNFNGHGGGTLLATIGDDDKFIKVGSKVTFTAAKSGVLELGIAIQPEYANDSYQFPGTYKVKITVESVPTEGQEVR